MNELDKNDLIEERKKKIINLLNKQKDWVYYTILGFIVLVSIYIRSRNISKLKDITTGTWTLGPDLDPFLFLRWAEYIVEHGKLMAIDTMRYVPLGFDTAYEMRLLPYLIAWFHKFLSFFSLSDSVTYSAIIFPVFMAGLTAIAFFLFARKIFYKEDRKTKNIIALIATGFFILVPSLLPRTIAGIPEKESAAFFFMFMAFYFFLEAFTSEKMKKSLVFGILAGITTGLMALIWGGATFVFMSIGGAVFFAFVLGKITTKRFYSYGLWILFFMILMVPFSTRYSLMNLITSISTGLNFLIFFIILTNFILFEKLKFNKKIRIDNIPKQIISTAISVVIILILTSIFFGIGFNINQFKEILERTVHPLSTTRFALTVAENRQPYFVSDWKNSLGPIVYNIPLFFWLFFIGSIAMFNHLIKRLRKKEKFILTFSYTAFLFCLIFSKYSPNSILNGESGLSLFVYFGGVLFFIGSFIYLYFKKYHEGTFHNFKEFNFSYILYFTILTMAIVGARGAVRLIMVLAAISPVAISFLSVKISQRAIKEQEETTKFFVRLAAIIIILMVVLTLWTYYKQDRYTSENFAPSMYNMQWQKAMSWVRENTSKDAVFAHWWDYGYWIQSIGERATILDGGNAIVYWNYLMGRYVLTGTNEKDALEFLYTHNGTHLLIDSTELGKYTAFSSIGSDENYDRFSWITNFFMNEKQTRETKDEIIYTYFGGALVDEDIIWSENGKDIFLPERKASVGAIILRKDKTGKILQPEAIFIYNNQQYRIPLRYAYYKNKLYDFGSGLDAGIFIYPKADITRDNNIRINEIGALYYLSKRTIHSNLINLYLFDKKSEYFKLVHTESNLIVENLRQQGQDMGEFIYYQGFQGPIKIWEINYPENIKPNQEYLLKTYPNKKLEIADKSKYNN